MLNQNSMTSIQLMRRSLIGCIAGLGLFFAPAPPSAAEPAAKEWPQNHSYHKPDPAVHFGTLPNGMRYAILHNTTPAGQASIRFRIGSGSLHETDAQHGLAHFLEHMAFKGSTHVPEGEMVKILQRNGLAFGPDTNATTSWTQTVYMLDLPKADSALMDTGLMLMREIASELTLSEEAMKRERGVVLSEERERDTPQERTRLALVNAMLEGQLAARRNPIGKTEIVQNATANALRDFYEANYRPDRAALVVAGDIDAAQVETKIKERFSNWRPAGPGKPEPDLGAAKLRELTVASVEQPGSADQLRLIWTRPFRDTHETETTDRLDTAEVLATLILNDRLDMLAQGEHPPFLNAQSTEEDVARSINYTSINAAHNPGAWRETLTAIDQEQRRLVQYGATQEELGRVILQLRTGLQNLAAGAASRPTPDLATEIVKSIDDDNVFMTPGDTLELLDKIMASLSLSDVDAGARRAFSGSGPLIFAAAPSAPEGGEAAVKTEYVKAHAAPVAAPAAAAAYTWSYTSFGTPGAVAEQEEIGDLGVVAARFANGVRLSVKQTRFSADQVLVKVRVGNGAFDLPQDRPVKWMTDSFVEGGLKSLKMEELNRALTGRLGKITFSLGEDAFFFGGLTNARDLDVQMQLLAAYVTDPAYRPEAFERVRTIWLGALRQSEATATGVYERDLSGLLHAGDPRWSAVSREKAESARPEEQKALLEGPLANGSIEITIVGDVAPETAIKFTAATFGALPPRSPAPLSARARAVHFPAPSAEPLVRRHKGRADDAIAFIAWPTPDIYSDSRLAAALGLASDALENRLREQLRETEGVTYTPQAGNSASDAIPGYGFFWSKVETQPSRVAGFYALVSRITAEMSANGVTSDELVRAKAPVVEGIKKSVLSNEFWLNALDGSQAEPRRLDLIRTRLARYEAVTSEDIKRAVAEYLGDDKAWKLVILPENRADGTQAAPPSR